MEYPAGKHNTVHRLAAQRGAYDLKTVHGIINQSLVLHVSFVPNSEDLFPTIIPMIGAMGSFEYPSADIDEPLDCYIHGYVSARMANLARDAMAKGEPGLPVCVSAARVDGLILAMSAFAHSCNYRSASIFGHASLVTDPEEKMWALRLITNNLISGRWEETRQPPSNNELVQTQILRIKVKSGSAKVRAAPPSEVEDDMKNDMVRQQTWSGYIPLLEQLQDPVPAKHNLLESVPQHILSYRDAFNQGANMYNEEVKKRVLEIDTVFQNV